MYDIFLFTITKHCLEHSVATNESNETDALQASLEETDNYHLKPTDLRYEKNQSPDIIYCTMYNKILCFNSEVLSNSHIP